LFQRRGYAAVAVSDVADAVGITKAAVHYYFETKAELYAAVMRTVLEGIQRGIRAMTSVPGPVSGKLHQLALFAVMAIQSNADLDAMMRDADEHLSASQRQELDQAHAGIIAALSDLMREGMATGELTPGDPDFLGHAFWHLLGGFSGRAGAVSGYHGRPEVASSLVEMFLRGAGPRPTMKGTVGDASTST
jgi:AcrR family transcriptional regulator